MGIAVVFPDKADNDQVWGTPWRDTPAWRVVTDAEEVLGRPLGPLLLDAGEAQLDETDNAQLVMLLAGLMAWQAVEPRLDARPIVLAGHSLGQVTALIAAGVLPFADGVRLADERARATADAAARRPGRMVALLGSSLRRRRASRAEHQASAGSPTTTRLRKWCWPERRTAWPTPPPRPPTAGSSGSSSSRSAAPFTPRSWRRLAALAPALAAAPWSPGWVPVLHNADAERYDGGDGWAGRLAEHLVARALAGVPGAARRPGYHPPHRMRRVNARRACPPHRPCARRRRGHDAGLARLAGHRMSLLEDVDVDVHAGVPERVVVAPAGGRFRPCPAGDGHRRGRDRLRRARSSARRVRPRSGAPTSPAVHRLPDGDDGRRPANVSARPTGGVVADMAAA